jgi:hypothetical protein
MTHCTVIAYRENRLSDYGYDAHNSEHDIEVFETPEGAAESIARMRFNDETGKSVPHCDRFHEWEITLLIDGVPEDHWFDTDEERERHQTLIQEVRDLEVEHLEKLRAKLKEEQRREREAKQLQKQREDAEKALRKAKDEKAEYERLKAKFDP